MRVLFLTSWNTACGIATYSHNLIEQLEKLGVECEVFPHTQDYTALSRLARESTADVVHIQHEFGIAMTPEPLMSVIGKFRMRGKAVVITMHTEDKPMNIILDGIPDAIILHNDTIGLSKRNTFSKFYKVPHGIPEVQFSEGQDFYKTKYGIPKDAFVIGTCGFVSKDRAAIVENFTTEIAPLMMKYPNWYLHYPMSAHRNDPNGSFAALVRSTVEGVAKKHGFGDRVQMTAEFMDTQQFRERLFTLDMGFSYVANTTAGSNSGAAADIISCGVPTVVNNAVHFSHIKDYCKVVEGGLSDLVSEIGYIYQGTDTYSRLLLKSKQAVKDLGYSVVANKHIEIYEKAVTDLKIGPAFKDTEFTAKLGDTSRLNKQNPIVVTVPNSLWQVLLLWRKLAVLVEQGFSIKLLVQNEGAMNISTLKFMLKGLVEVQFGEMGLGHDPRLVKMYSRSLAQNMSTDVENWLKDNNKFEDLFAFIDPGFGIDYDVKLGDYAMKAAERLVKPDTTLVFPYDDIEKLQGIQGNICVIGTPLMTQEVTAAEKILKSTQYSSVSAVVEDFRTVMACCLKARSVITPWNDFAAFTLMNNSGALIPSCAGAWQVNLIRNWPIKKA